MGDRLNVSVWKDSCMSSGEKGRKNNLVLVGGDRVLVNTSQTQNLRM